MWTVHRKWRTGKREDFTCTWKARHYSGEVQNVKSLCSKFIHETVYLILSKSPKLCRRYYKKNTLVSFYRINAISTLQGTAYRVDYRGHTACCLLVKTYRQTDRQTDRAAVLVVQAAGCAFVTPATGIQYGSWCVWASPHALLNTQASSFTHSFHSRTTSVLIQAVTWNGVLPMTH